VGLQLTIPGVRVSQVWAPFQTKLRSGQKTVSCELRSFTFEQVCGFGKVVIPQKILMVSYFSFLLGFILGFSMHTPVQEFGIPWHEVVPSMGEATGQPSAGHEPRNKVG